MSDSISAAYLEAAGAVDPAPVVDMLVRHPPFRAAVDDVAERLEPNPGDRTVTCDGSGYLVKYPPYGRVGKCPGCTGCRPAKVTPAAAEAFARARFGDAAFDAAGPIGRANAVDAAHEWLTAAVAFLAGDRTGVTRDAA